jgi:hypothetical protein
MRIFAVNFPFAPQGHKVRLRRLAVQLSFILIAVSAVHAEEKWAGYSEVHSFSYSEPFTIHGLFHDLAGGRRDGEAAFTFTKVEIGAHRGRWQVGAFTRYGYYLEFTPDTARLYYQREHDLPLDSSATYNLQLYGSHLRAEGVGISHHWQVTKSLWLKPRINLIHGSELIDGEISGQFATAAENGISTYASTAQGEYYYSEDVLFDRLANRPSGKGATLDVQIGWRPTLNLELAARIDDAWSMIRWQDAPHTVFAGDSNTFAVDAEGRLSSKPLVSGVEDYQTLNQRLPVRTWLSGQFRFNEADALRAELFLVRAVTMPRLGYQRKLSTGAVLNLAYDFKTAALGMGLELGGFKAAIMADNLDYQKCHLLDLYLYYLFIF